MPESPVDPTPEEIAFLEGVYIGETFLKMYPDHEVHGDPVAFMAFGCGGLYAMIARGSIPAPPPSAVGEPMPNEELVKAFVSGVATAYRDAHTEPHGDEEHDHNGEQPYTGKPKNDPDDLMYR